ncbi:MAG: DUF2808 domain-containing protein [Scytolyngbya sp. HA4215-MV1]|jgi:hypothetical protein|nr:DUF2808 domain-containing protein [Scytolyngbya sp. HA4215-MV1]
MKGYFAAGISALLLASTAAIVPVLTQPAQAQMRFNFTAPIIADSGIVGTQHFIRVAVTGMALQDLMIALPQQMERYDKINVVDQAGKEIPANIKATKERVAITFTNPVPPDSYVEVKFTNVQMTTGGGEYLYYLVTGKRSGLQGEIPIGTAQVRVPSRDGG